MDEPESLFEPVRSPMVSVIGPSEADPVSWELKPAEPIAGMQALLAAPSTGLSAEDDRAGRQDARRTNGTREQTGSSSP